MSHLKDLTGLTLGNLYVIKRLPNYVQENGRTRTRWLTKCMLCGNTYVADGSHLLHGDIVSCGCLKNKKASERMIATKGKQKKNSRTVDLTNKYIEEIYVIKKAPSIKGKVAWECKCPYCSNIFIARANHLLRGLIRSCGCVKSFAEKEIREYLDKNKVKFKKQYWFEDLINPDTGHILYFDFAFIDESENIIALLEYQGEQHDEKRKQSFGKQQREVTDKIKKEYCKAHNINLLEIWYYQDLITELDNIMINVLHVNPVQSKQDVA